MKSLNYRFLYRLCCCECLQEKQVTRIGEYRSRPVDIRIIAATNQDLKQWTDEGKFRLDLYYRLNVVELKVPSLKERKEDIGIRRCIRR